MSLEDIKKRWEIDLEKYRGAVYKKVPPPEQLFMLMEWAVIDIRKLIAVAEAAKRYLTAKTNNQFAEGLADLSRELAALEKE